MIYLASTSPRRKFLLRQSGVTFKTVRPDYEELFDPGHNPSRMVQDHALGKALSCVKKVKKGIILGADTVVYLGRRIIGKPKNMKDARRILGKLQNRTHTVYTGVALLGVHSGKIKKKLVFSETTKVKLRPLDETGITNYFKRVNPLDKAGAYAIQSIQPNIILRVKGSLANAIGLPMETILKKYRSFKT